MTDRNAMPSDAEMAAILRNARRMRAAAVRDLFAGAGAWLRGLIVAGDGGARPGRTA